jgi:hypothetical protein
MKHYLSYDAEGKLVGIHTHSHAGTGLKGWPDNCRLDNPNCPNETSKWFRENILGKNGVTGFVALNCECSPTEKDCPCASEAFQKMRLVGGVLVNKVEGALTEVGGGLIASGSTLRRAPGSKVKFKITGVGVTDGATAQVFQRGSVILAADSLNVSFTGGDSEEFEVTFPAQGSQAMVAIFGKEIMPLAVSVIGWA